MTDYSSRYTDSFLATEGTSYDRAISSSFELGIWELEKHFLGEILKNCSPGPARYLDFACGTGRIISHVGQYIEDRTGLDTSEQMIEVARKRVSSRFVVGNIIEDVTLLEGESFDLITCFRLFLNIEPYNRRLILDALGRYLADDGYLVLNNHMNRYSVLGITAFLLRRLRILPSRVEAARGRRGIIGTMSELEFRRLLAGSGYQVQRVYRFALLPGYRSLIVLPHSLLLRVELLLSRIPILNLFGKDQIYVCRKKSS
ncbi:class I SAM-dependent methyltransferase [Chloroflexota bacterium]